EIIFKNFVWLSRLAFAFVSPNEQTFISSAESAGGGLFWAFERADKGCSGGCCRGKPDWQSARGVQRLRSRGPEEQDGCRGGVAGNWGCRKSMGVGAGGRGRVESGEKSGVKLQNHQKAEYSQSLSGLQCAKSSNKGVIFPQQNKRVLDTHWRRTLSYLLIWFFFSQRTLQVSEIPKTYWEEMMSSDTTSWSKAVEAKLGAMNNQKVWKIIVAQEDKALLGTVWVFHKKKGAQGVVVKFKARLCAQGSKQREGLDFTHT
ncbi:uncharacterized protein VP01_2974g1, partial [Puccinia sorghi]